MDIFKNPKKKATRSPLSPNYTETEALGSYRRGKHSWPGLLLGQLGKCHCDNCNKKKIYGLWMGCFFPVSWYNNKCSHGGVMGHPQSHCRCLGNESIATRVNTIRIKWSGVRLQLHDWLCQSFPPL